MPASLRGRRRERPPEERPRGFLSAYRPQQKTRDLLEQVDAVLVEYADFLPLTLRQVFYRLVAAHDYPKTERACECLYETPSNARRGSRVSSDAIRDDGLTTHELPGPFA